MSIRVLLADDHQIFREGLRLILENDPAITVVGEAVEGLHAIALVMELNPDVVIMDISMPNLNGIEATRQILKKRPDLKVIALSVHSNERYVEGMLRAGAAGFLVKNCAADELILAIRTVLQGQSYLSPDITRIVVEEYVKHPAQSDSLLGNGLTAREREVLQMLAEGKTAKEIAILLSISVKTVEVHRQHIMNKLNLHNIVELTRYAIREGLSAL